MHKKNLLLILWLLWRWWLSNIEPKQESAYIIGERNSTVIATLNQPAALRCMAGGYPKPTITWFHGSSLLSLKSDRSEVTRDFSLIFKRVSLSDLGEYTCHAYSGIGKPTSITITMKTVGPVSSQNPDDQQYLKYVIAAPQAPTRPEPRYPHRPTRLPPRIIPPPVVVVPVERPRVGKCCFYTPIKFWITLFGMLAFETLHKLLVVDKFKNFEKINKSKSTSNNYLEITGHFGFCFIFCTLYRC
jgi:Immunoglobulin domain